MTICKYSDRWGCSQLARHDGFCSAHAVLFTWLVHGDGDSIERIREHDSVAGLPEPALTATLRSPTWDPRIRAVLGVA